MRGAWLLVLLLLAGCTAPEPSDDPIGDDEAGRQSLAGSQKAGAENRTRVLDHVIDWQPDAAPAATTMVVPDNASRLVLRVENIPTAPCGANWGEQDSPASPGVTLAPPSGQSTFVDLFTQECDTGVVFVATLLAEAGLPIEPGSWDVTFHGRGTGLRQHLMVDASA